MNFTIDTKGNYTVIQSNVEKLDATNASELKSELVLINKNAVNSIILDLNKTKYCDSSGLSAILIGNRLCKDAGGVFALSGLQANVEKMVKISQLDKVLNIYENLKAATSFIETK
ncbi:anti-anti-sigma factor [Putridiphycobacter roseus]|uniref:Anti-sigma factor antagonist n=1 Tax=Putridiphycobacter roseus TaxID=2219161 RepID=A0A2W1NE05_9FLAO|nr:STAS domain-containing protein [Putridiphycobacter roseus]PZE17655.1 anti-anti-sigma factor [Putridiphycobacter roseus]